LHGQTGILGQFALRYAHYCRMNLISNGAIRRTGGRVPCRALPPPRNETPSAHRPRLKMIDTARDQHGRSGRYRPTPGRKRSVSPLLRHALWRRVGGRKTQGTPQLRRRRADVVARLQVQGGLRQPVQGDRFAPGVGLGEAAAECYWPPVGKQFAATICPNQRA